MKLKLVAVAVTSLLAAGGGKAAGGYKSIQPVGGRCGKRS